MHNEIAIKVETQAKVYHLYYKQQDRFKEALNLFKIRYKVNLYLPPIIIDAEALKNLAQPLAKNGYGQYLLQILKEENK